MLTPASRVFHGAALKLRRIPFWLAATVLIVVTFVGIGGWYYYTTSNRILWTMVHVSGDRYSGDAHLLEFPDGHVVLIDTGFDHFTRGALIPYLDDRGIDHIDQLIITHAHRNHYGGVVSLIDHLKHIGEIYFNLPPKSQCDKETWSTGCDYQHVLQTRQAIEKAGVPIHDLATDDVLYNNDKQDIILEVVHVHDGVSKPIGRTDINDTSAVLRLVYGRTKVLFAGDLNRKGGDYLVDQNFVLKSDILTAPHHGVESAASNRFLNAADPQVLMVSNSAGEWQGARGARMRRFAADHHIPAYVTGLNGNVVVTLKRDGFTVDPQHQAGGD